MLYPNSLTVREARNLYFKNSGFDDRTYADKWVRLPVMGFTVYLPNLEPRKKAVPLHDIDHVLTEYRTDWIGEWEISSYELGTGCGPFWMGWLINMQAIIAGGVRAPKRCINAFARGRQSKGIYNFTSVECLLNNNLGELRRETTAPPEVVRPKISDIFFFYLWVAGSIVLHLLPIAAIGFVALPR